MPPTDEYRELLFADVALLRGLAEARDVAAALQRYWDRRAEPGVTLAGELGRLVDLDPKAVSGIRAEVERLAGAAGAAPAGPLAPTASLPIATAGDAAAMPLREVAPDRYVDFMPVGEGGMGIVYWAVDSDLKRQVAFKVVRPPGEASAAGVTPALPFQLRTPDAEDDGRRSFDELKARFLQEAWVTGGMEHPGIVPVYDLGRTGGGVPYYTMKFVRGSRTLATALQEAAGRGMEARLELLESFLKVCDTIRYAHSRGVIHRDLKPDNIAIGDYGEVVVLDWGLARLTDREEVLKSRWQGSVRAFRESADLKTMTSAVGTPGYMAPEAAEGLVEDLDERSDVYSLGAILFEILTGRTPFAFRTFREYQAQVVGEDAPDAHAVDPEVPEPLAAVCRGALARALHERTARVDAIASAVRAWQAQRAVDREVEGLLREADAGIAAAADLVGDAMLRQADRAALACRRALELCPAHAGALRRLADTEHARERGIQERERLARRRLLRVVAGGALAAAAIVAAVVAWVLEERRQEAEEARATAAAARGQAEDDRARAERVMSFMVGDMQESLEPIGRLDLLAKLGHEARTYFENLPPDRISTASLRNGTIALRKLGDVHFEQGDLPAAKQAYEASASVAESLVRAAPGDAEGDTLLSLARAQVGRVLIAQGYPTHAVDVLGRHLEDARARAGRTPESLEGRAALAQAHYLLGEAHAGRRAIDEALPNFERARELGQALAREQPDDAAAHRHLVRYLLAPVSSLAMVGRAADAGTSLAAARQVVRTWRTRLPKDVRWVQLEADVELFAGRVARALGHMETALGHLRAAGAAYRTLWDLAPGNMTYLSRIGTAEKGIGIVLDLEGKRLYREELERRKAEGNDEKPPQPVDHHPHWREAYRIQKLLFEKDPSNAHWVHGMIDLCNQMSQVEWEASGDAARMTAYRDAALDYARRLRGCDADNVLWQHLYAYTLFQHAERHAPDDPAEAARRYREVVDVCEAIAPRHKAGLVELAILSVMAAHNLAPLLEDRADLVAVRRQCVGLLLRANAAQPTDAQAFKSLLGARVELASLLAAGDEGERREAADLLQREIERLEARPPDLAEALHVMAREKLPLLREQRAALVGR